MAAASVTVAPGLTPTVLGDTLSSGTTIYNTDNSNGVWISSSSTISPGNGQYIGPLGSLVWSTDGARVFACLDTAATTPVVLQVSDDYTQIDNPVAVGAAVATELLESGIPIVATQTVLAENYAIVAGGTLQLDISQFSSLTLIANNAANDNTTRVWEWLQCDDSPNANVISADYFATMASTGSTALGVSEVIQVVGSQLFIQQSSGPAGIISVTVIGSTRSALARVDARTFATTGIQLAGSGTIATGAALLLQPLQSGRLQGNVFASMSVNPASAKGAFLMNVPGFSNSFRLCDSSESVTTANSTSWVVFRQLAVPAGNYTISYLNETAGNVTVSSALFSAIAASI